jgi:hypothetical protein
MFHLVQPVWSAFMPGLLAKAAPKPPLERSPPAGAQARVEQALAAAATAAAAAASDVPEEATAASAEWGSVESTGPGREAEGGAQAATWCTATWLAVPILKVRWWLARGRSGQEGGRRFRRPAGLQVPYCDAVE